MKRRIWLTVTAMAALGTGCFYDQWFDLEWDEEVLLHDGRVIVVHLKHSYERRSSSFTRYDGLILPRDTTLTLDAGGSIGRVTQLFKGFHPMFLGQYEGEWYAVLYGGDYYRSRELPGQDWGDLEGPDGQWAIKLVHGKWIPISMSRLPEVFQQPNMLLLYGTVAEHAEFNGKRLTLKDKQAWLGEHPLGPESVRLTRPTAASPRRKDSIAQFPQGDKK